MKIETNSIQYKILDHLTTTMAVSVTTGSTIYEELKSYLEKNLDSIIYIDFDGVNLVNTAFLNAAIGQLYGVFSSDFLEKV